MTEMDYTLRSIVKTFRMPSINSQAKIADAICKMVEAETDALLVLRKDPSDAYGLITKRDIVYRVIAEGKDPRKMKVKDVMTKPLIVLTNLNLDIQWVAKAMTNSNTCLVAVFDEGDFYGFVTESCITDGIYHVKQRRKLDQESDFVSC